MNILFDGIKGLLNDYNELIDLETSDMDSAEVFGIEKDKYNFDNNFDDDDYASEDYDDYDISNSDEYGDHEEKTDDDMTDEEYEDLLKYKAYTMIVSKIKKQREEDYQGYVKLMTLWGLEYYNLYHDEYENSDGDEVIQLMVDAKNRYDFCEKIMDDSDMMFQLISGITEVYVDDALENYDYELFTKALLKNLGCELYKKYHPDLLSEYDGYTKWVNDNKACELFRKQKIDSLPKFVFTLCAVNHDMGNKHQLRLAIFNKLSDIRDKDKKLFDQIYMYMYEYGYSIINYKRNNHLELNDNEESLEYIINSLEIDKFLSEKRGIDVLIRNFIDYDIMNYSMIIDNQSERTKRYIKSLSRYLK